MAGAGYKLFNTGDVLTAAQVNTYLQEQTVMVFASSTARTTALSGVLAEGMMSYLQDTNAVEVYNGTSWVNVGNAGDLTEIVAGTGITVTSGTGPIPTVALTTPVAETNGGTAQSTYTTGDLLYASATNTLAKRAIGSTDQVLKVSGGIPTWAVDPTTDVVTTAGDLIYGTGADAVTRLGIGTAGQVLKVNSGATAPEWGAAGGAGALTLTGSSDFTTSSSISINNCFSATYINYVILMNLTAASADVSFNLKLRASGTDASSNYNMNRLFFTGTSSTVSQSLSASSIEIGEVATSYPTLVAFEAFLYAPFLAQATSGFSRCKFNNNQNTSYFEIKGYNHTTATSYDGFSIIPASGTLSGKIRVYGYALT